MFITHPFDPLFDSNSKILILGSFPSVKSRETNFFYGHRQNRFWYVMAALLGYRPIVKPTLSESDSKMDTRRCSASYNQTANMRENAIGLNFYVPQTVDEKKDMLLSNGIALWDTIASCDIEGSSDSSITNVTPNDLSIILDNAAISTIGLNGTKSYELFMRYTAPGLRTKYGAAVPAFKKLPSTSPANAAWSKDRLVEEWRGQLFV